MAQQLIQLIERNERKRQKNIVIPNLNISKTSIAFKVNVTTTVPIYYFVIKYPYRLLLYYQVHFKLST